MLNQQFREFEGFDFMDDVIGDDLVVEGVVYDSQIWMAEGEGGVMRRDAVEEFGDLRDPSAEGDVDEEIAVLLHPNPWNATT